MNLHAAKWVVSSGLVIWCSLLVRDAWACSGPGAAAAIQKAEAQGWLMFAGAMVLGAASMGLRRWSGMPWNRCWWPMVVAAAHPGWWFSARMGDCGTMRVLGSVGMLAVMVLLTVALIIMALARRGRARESS